MNRTTAILVALATLLAHVLALNQTTEGTFAPPHELAHVAFRLARNLVYEGALAWNPGGELHQAYPSYPWVAVCAVATRLYLPVTLVSQGLGIVFSLATVIVLAQFSRDRLAGLIALLLFVVAGTTAAAAGSGTEAPLLTLLATASFLAFEHRRPRSLAVLLVLLVGTRDDAWPFALALGAFEARRRWLGRVAREDSLLPAFGPPLAAMAAVVVLRRLAFGTWLSPYAHLLLDPDPGRWRLGLDYVLSFFLRSGAAILVVFPIVYLVRGSLSGTGRRALWATAVWAAQVALVGGDHQPFWVAMAPAVPLLYLAVQEAMILAMDSRRPGLAPATWGAFLVGIVASGLASRVPADLGALPLERVQLAWMEPTERMARAYDRPLGRLGLMQEIREVERLRSLAVFLRDRLDPAARILSPWPGTIGYLSRREVLDLLGRATPAFPGERTRSWYGTPRVDLAEALARDVDYLLVARWRGGDPPRLGEVVPSWVERFDERPDEPRRAAALVDSLRRFELVAVPVPESSAETRILSAQPHYLLRNRELELSPELAVVPDEGALVVLATHRGHQQVVDLELRVETADGRRLWVRPTGELSPDPAHARTDLVLYTTGQRPVELMRLELPAASSGAAITAVLQNPSNAPEPEFAAVSDRVVVRVP